MNKKSVFPLGMIVRKMKMNFAILLVFIMVLSALGSNIRLAAADQLGSSIGEKHGNELSTSSVSQLMDTILLKQLKDYRIPGAVVAVVSGGKQLYAKGYGMADIEKGKLMNAENSGVIMASVAKLITATAVMQLVEQGKLDLHTNINQYLASTKLKIPDTFPGHPITLHHLLTHTGGFDEVKTNSAVLHSEEIIPLGDFLTRNRATRLRPPGTFSSYDNYGFALAGYIVEVVSGKNYNVYVEEQILRPLSMNGTSFMQPAPAKIEEGLAHGYYSNGDKEIPTSRKYSALTPMGAGPITTASDMGKLMIAFLHPEQSGNKPILHEENIKEMERSQFSNDPRLPGVGYAFEQYNQSNERFLAKDGDIPGYSTNFVLIPSQDVGIFVAYNGNDIGGGTDFARKDLVNQFIDHFFTDSPHPAPVTFHDADLSRFDGIYRSTRYSRVDYTKIGTLFSSVKVQANNDGSLTTTGLSVDPNKDAQKWIQIEPRLFEEEGGQYRIAFGKAADGTIKTLFTSWDQAMTLQHLSWYQLPSLHLPLLAGSLSILFVAAVIWPAIGAIRRRKRESDSPSQSTQGSKSARWLRWAGSLITLLFVTGFIWLLSDISALAESSLIGISPMLKVILLSASFAGAFAVGMIVCAVLAWRKRWWSWPERLWSTIVAVAAVCFTCLAAFYNLVGWPIIYY